MAVIRCSKGHYYDDTKFAQCPHCGVLPAMEPEKPAKAKRFSFFRKESPSKQPASPVIPAGQVPVVPSPVSGSQQPGGDYDDRTVGLSQMPGGGPADDDRTIAFGQPQGGDGYGDDDNRTIAFGQPQGGYGYGEDDNRTIAFGRGTDTGLGSGSSIDEDDNRTIAFGRGTDTGLGSGSSIDEDDNRTIAFGRGTDTGLGSGGSIDEDDNRTIAFGRGTDTDTGIGGSPVNEDDNRTIAFGRGANTNTGIGGSPVNEDDNRTIAFSRGTDTGLGSRSSIDEDDNRTIAFSRPGGGYSGSSQPAKPLDTGRSGQAAAKPVPAAAPSVPQPKAQPVSGAVGEETFPLSPEQYVAGWLVCVKGSQKGRDYRLYKGFNRMGSRQNADIPLPEELTDTVCALVYDDRGNQFYLVQQSGDPVYLNENPVKGSMEIRTGDRIKAGAAEFEFIAFCREGKTWDD